MLFADIFPANGRPMSPRQVTSKVGCATPLLIAHPCVRVIMISPMSRHEVIHDYTTHKSRGRAIINNYDVVFACILHQLCGSALIRTVRKYAQLLVVHQWTAVQELGIGQWRNHRL
jgi:hypothetical protein